MISGGQIMDVEKGPTKEPEAHAAALVVCASFFNDAYDIFPW